MTKEIIIILLLIALFYYYRQSQTQPAFLSGGELNQVNSTNQTLVNFLRDQLNSNSLERSPDNLGKLLEELRTKLGEKNLDEILEERHSLAEALSKAEELNEDYETEIDTLTRTKNSLEADLLAQSNAFQNRLREKDRENKKQKEDLTNLEKRFQKAQGDLSSEKQINKGNIERINLLTKQVQEKQVRTEEVDKLKEKLKFYTENLKTKEGIIEEYKVSEEQLKKQKETATQELNSILTKWTFENKSVESASEFLEKFEKWIASCHKIEQNWVEWKDKGKKELERLTQIITTQEQKIKELASQDNTPLRNHIRELQAECNKKVVSWDLEKISRLSQELSNFERERERERAKPFDLPKDGERANQPEIKPIFSRKRPQKKH